MMLIFEELKRFDISESMVFLNAVFLFIYFCKRYTSFTKLIIQPSLTVIFSPQGDPSLFKIQQFECRSCSLKTCSLLI